MIEFLQRCPDRPDAHLQPMYYTRGAIIGVEGRVDRDGERYSMLVVDDGYGKAVHHEVMETAEQIKEKLR